MFRFYCRTIAAPVTELQGPEAHHLHQVLRLKAGGKVELFDGAGKVAAASIKKVKRHSVILAVERIDTIARPFLQQVIIAAAVAKGERFDWLVSKCTELGVDGIIPVLFERAVKLARNPKAAQRWSNIAISAAKQCGRAYLPQIDTPLPLPKALDTINSRHPGVKLLFGGVDASAVPIIDWELGSSDIVAFVGPEGGMTAEEERLLRDRGAKAVRITETVLRVETAAVAFAAILTAGRYAAKAGK